MGKLSVSTAVKAHTDQEMTEKAPGKWDIVVPNPKTKKTARLCFFVTSLIVVMLAAVVLVVVIKISLASRDETCCFVANGTKAEAEKGANVKEDKRGEGVDLDISWEMKRAFLELRQMMGDFKPVVLYPIYRKDLPLDYIAYYEVKLKHKDGYSYAVISSGEETGDYSLVETGGTPSPLDELRKQAYTNGFYCSKFYRLTTDGITICEDHRLNKVVASTGHIFPGKQIKSWEELDGQVSKLLPQVRNEWAKMARVAGKLKEWKVWGKSSIIGEPMDFRKVVTERGLFPGESIDIPVENSTTVQIKFVGLSRRNSIQSSLNISLRSWQSKLCKVLNNICDPRRITGLRRNLTTSTFAGTKYLKLGVNSDEKYVKTTLENQEVRFQVELRTGSGKQIVLRYGLSPRARRLGRSLEHSRLYKIPDEGSFPNIRFHGDCVSASTMLSAWTMIFSYYDNMMTSKPELHSRKRVFLRDGRSGSLLTAKEKQNYIATRIAPQIDMKCTLFAHKRKHWRKTRLENWLRREMGQRSKIVLISGMKKRVKATRKAISLVKRGIPVVITIEHKFTSHPSYGVVTRMRQQQSSYRHCDHVNCTPWQEVALTEFFVRDGQSPGKWQTACTYYTAALIQ